MNYNKDITYSRAVRAGRDILESNNIDNADYDSFALFEHVTGIGRTQYLIHSGDPMDKGQYAAFLEHINQRAAHIPLQHILGKAYFYGYEFKVNENVLVPRPDTEVLVEQVMKVANENSTVLDMCTGSGCIILTLALEGHLKNGVGVDVSEAAIAVAEDNRRMHSLVIDGSVRLENGNLKNDNLRNANLKNATMDNITFIKSDLYSELDDTRFDVIVSNPPYIRSEVIPTLTEEVRLHDPMLALDGFEDGLYFYRKITEQSVNHMKTGGWLMYEIGHDQAEDVSLIMTEAGYSQVSVVKDLAGLDRVVKGILL